MEEQTPQEIETELLTPSSGASTAKRPTYKRMIHAAIRNLVDSQDGTPNTESIVSHINEAYALGRGSCTRINTILSKMVDEHAIIAKGKRDKTYRLPKRAMAPSAGKKSKKGSGKKTLKKKGAKKCLKKKRAKKRVKRKCLAKKGKKHRARKSKK